MVAGNLAVDYRKPAFLQPSTQRNKANFGRIADAAEHTFSKKHLPEYDAVQAANQLILLPYFDGVGIVSLVEFIVGLGHGIRNPGVGFACQRVGITSERAGLNHLGKGFVAAYPEHTLSEFFT